MQKDSELIAVVQLKKNTPVLNLKLSSTSPKPVTKSFFFSEQY